MKVAKDKCIFSHSVKIWKQYPELVCGVLLATRITKDPADRTPDGQV